jgi:mannose-6-phosphate isomerase-like protein (cupin superfamily)
MQRHKHRTEIWWFLKGSGYRDPDNIDWMAYPFMMWKIKKERWHTFKANADSVYAIELQYGRKVTESDIERK